MDHRWAGDLYRGTGGFGWKFAGGWKPAWSDGGKDGRNRGGSKYGSPREDSGAGVERPKQENMRKMGRYR